MTSLAVFWTTTLKLQVLRRSAGTVTPALWNPNHLSWTVFFFFFVPKPNQILTTALSQQRIYECNTFRNTITTHTNNCVRSRKRSANCHNCWEPDVTIFAREGGDPDWIGLRIWWHIDCVSIQVLHPSEEHLKANYITTARKDCTNSKAPPDAAHKYAFFSLFLEDALLPFFVASHIPKLFVWPKKK